MDAFRLDNKVALITGAGSGLGKQFALTLADAGAVVVLAARRREKLEETAETIRRAGGTAMCCDLDVTDSVSIAACFEEIQTTVGAADNSMFLINSATCLSSSTTSTLSRLPCRTGRARPFSRANSSTSR